MGTWEQRHRDMVGILCGNTCTSSGGPLEDLGGVFSHFPLRSQATVSREEAESGPHPTSWSSSWKDATALPSPLHGCPCSQCLYSHDPKRLRCNSFAGAFWPSWIPVLLSRDPRGSRALARLTQVTCPCGQSVLGTSRRWLALVHSPTPRFLGAQGY